jgi:hypothetical protein
MFNLSMVKNGSLIELEAYIISAENGQIALLINFNETIECASSLLYLNLSQTKYIP